MSDIKIFRYRANMGLFYKQKNNRCLFNDYLKILILFIPIMRATLNNSYNSIFNFINNPVSSIYSSTPISAQIIFQSFWFTDSCIAVSINIFYKFQYSLKNFFVIFCPVFKFFPCFISSRLNHNQPREQCHQFFPSAQ